VEECAFPRAIRPDDRADFAAPDFEIDSPECNEAAKANGQGLGAYDRGRLATPAGFARGRLLKRKIERHLRELAGWRADRLLLWNHLEDAVLAGVHVEDELTQEGLVILLAQYLVALREVVTFLHLEPFQRLDQLHRVLAAAEFRFLHAELEGVDRLVIRLHVAVGQRTRGIDLLE